MAGDLVAPELSTDEGVHSSPVADSAAGRARLVRGGHGLAQGLLNSDKYIKIIFNMNEYI